jgi:hypothetical protein
VTVRTPLLFVLAVLTVACGSSATTSTTVTSPTSSRCEATVSPSATSFGPSGGTGTLNIVVARECTWRATSPVGWIAFTTTTEGQGDGTVGYRVSENADPVPRQASVSVADRSVPLSQQGSPCLYTLVGVPSTMSGQGGQALIDLRAHAACSWTARSESSWAQVTPTSGSGTAQLRVSVSANAGAERLVSLTIAGQPVIVTQQSGAAVPVPAPPSPTPTPGPTPTPTPTPTPPPPSPTPTPTPTPTPPPPTPTSPTPVREITLSGEISAVTGVCPTWRFSLESLTVYTTVTTTYEKGPCSRIKDGIKLDVEGWLMSDGTVRADRIRF